MEKLKFTIIKDGNPILRKKSVEVKLPLSKEDEEIVKFLHDYLVLASDDKKAEELNLKPGVGLAAPQIGINKRMIAVYIPYPDEKGNIAAITQYALVNPKIVSSAVRPAYILGGEGCLSVDENHDGFVIRSSIIEVEGYDYLSKKDVHLKLRGYEAIVFQHEIDHLDGILYYDRINKKEPEKHIPGALEI